MPNSPEVVVVGAGPYGLSIAAHLRAAGVPFRIFGRPMSTWSEHMPPGMLLKSDGFASNLSDPDSTFTLGHFCQENGFPYHDTKLPVQLSTFVAYGLAFQKRFVPQLDPREVSHIEQHGNGFRVRLEDGEEIETPRVVLAVGITHFAYIPEQLRHLAPGLVSHSSSHSGTGALDGEAVTVIGGGASALDLAALLHESGANVCIVARRRRLEFHQPPTPGPRSLWQRLRFPPSGLGPGWPSRLYSNHPELFRFLPSELRVRIVREHLSPAAGWPMKERVLGKVPLFTGAKNLRAEEARDGVRLEWTDENGAEREHSTGRVIAATGYRPDVDQLTFLSAEIRSTVRTLAKAPVLSPSFESSVPGLYFAGIAAAHSFGPLMRFAFGASFAAKTIAGSLASKQPSRRLTQTQNAEKKAGRTAAPEQLLEGEAVVH